MDFDMIEVHIEGVDDRVRDYCVGNVPQELVDDFFDQLERTLCQRAKSLGIFLLYNRRDGFGIKGVRLVDCDWDALKPYFFMCAAEAYSLAMAKTRKHQKATAAARQ
jgi:hypothetical protein